MAKKESFFWTSYSDLMTSLFFIMLVLFVMSLVIVNHNNDRIKKQNEELIQLQDSLRQAKDSLQYALDMAMITIEKQKRLIKIDEQFSPLIQSGIFKYYPDTRKFVAKDFMGVEIFEPNQAVILPQYRGKIIELGDSLANQLMLLSKNNPDFKYQMIIEGNVANSYDNRFNKDDYRGYMLSYERALSVYLLWKEKKIDLRKYNTEVLICGSGFNGLDRDPKEENNKRFSIQIIPKVSSPHNNSTKDSAVIKNVNN